MNPRANAESPETASTSSAYTPRPIDVSDVVLPPELDALSEQIAEQVHEVWAQGRMAEGWTYGPVKDSDRKTTPCLVPYAELPETEKEYDRRTAFAALKLLVKLGYRLEKDGGRR